MKTLSPFKLLLLSFVLTWVTNSCDSEDIEGTYAEWDGNGVPALIQEYIKEFGMTYEYAKLSYAVNVSLVVEKFEYNDNHFLSFKYTMFDGKEVTHGQWYCDTRGSRISGEIVANSYNKTKQVVYTTQVGGEEGFIPQVQGVEDSSVVAWMQGLIDEICEQRDNTGETTIVFDLFTLDCLDNTFVILCHQYITPDDKVVAKHDFYEQGGNKIATHYIYEENHSEETIYYNQEGDEVDEPSPLFDGIIQHINDRQPVWDHYVRLP